MISHVVVTLYDWYQYYDTLYATIIFDLSMVGIEP